MVVLNAFKAYVANFVSAAAFLLLGLFVFVFLLFENMFVSSGTVFLEYNVLGESSAVFLFQLFLAVLFIAFFSLFLVVMIFAVRQHMNNVKFETYLKEKVPRFTLEMFEFLLLFSIVAFAVGVILTNAGLAPWLVALVLFVLAAVVFFVPQSIVVDEVSWWKGLDYGVHFFVSHFGLAIFVFVIGVVLLGLLPFVELFMDQFAFLGKFVSLFLVLVFVLPFLETLKTVAYLSKFDLVQNAL